MSASVNTAPSFHRHLPVASIPVDVPPFDPDDWTDEQWIEWLRATETVEDVDRRAYAPRLSSPVSAVLGAAMMGLQKGIYGDVEKPEVVIEIDADGQDDGVKVVLDPDDPSQSTIVVRPD
jgi:hypothetical protein